MTWDMCFAWGLVFVDDAFWWLSLPTCWEEAAVVTLLHVALSIPRSWKKLDVGQRLPWLGVLFPAPRRSPRSTFKDLLVPIRGEGG